jgi:O-antigen ligase
MRGGLASAPAAAVPATPAAHAAPAYVADPAAAVDAGPLSACMKVALVVLVLFVGRVQDLHPATTSLPLAKLLLPLGVLLFFLDRRHLLRMQAITSTHGKTFLFFFFAVALSVPFSILRSGALPKLIDMLVGTLPYVIVLATAALTPREMRRYMLALVVTIVIIALALLGGLGVNLEGRQTVSTMYDPNDLAHVAVTVLPMAVFALRERGLLWKALGAGACASILAIIGMTASRGGLLGFATVVLVLLVRRGTMKARYKLLVVPALLSGLAFAPDTLWNRLAVLGSEDDYNVTSESGRKEIWTRGVKIFAGRPITGVGVHQYWVADGKFPGRGWQDLSWHTAHNSVLQVAVELGLVGFIPWVMLFWLTFVASRRARRLQQRGMIDQSYADVGDALTLSIIGFFASGMFLSAGYSMIAMTLAAFGMAYTAMVARAELAARAMPAGIAGPAAPVVRAVLSRGGL